MNLTFPTHQYHFNVPCYQLNLERSNVWFVKLVNNFSVLFVSDLILNISCAINFYAQTAAIEFQEKKRCHTPTNTAILNLCLSLANKKKKKIFIVILPFHFTMSFTHLLLTGYYCESTASKDESIVQFIIGLECHISHGYEGSSNDRVQLLVSGN